MLLHIGLDDTDSKEKFCTTFLGYKLIELSKKHGAKLVDFPKLIRLNPNIPYKTRGNAAVAFSIVIDESDLKNFKEEVIEKFKELSDFEEKNTNPGLVFVKKIPKYVSEFSKRALRHVVKISDAQKILDKLDADYYKFKKGRGIIGALAAIGYEFGDFTYELLVYRNEVNWGTRRKIDHSSVFKMNRETYPKTFNNIDDETNKILISPNTSCPILCGVRAEEVDILNYAFEILKFDEDIEGDIIYKTNQHTDANVILKEKLDKIENLTTIETPLSVVSKPYTHEGSHTFFFGKNNGNKLKICSFYPTSNLRKVVQKLIVSDKIRVWGSIRNKDGEDSLNLEKMKIEKCQPKIIQKNPICPNCKKRSESGGRNQEYRCKRCKLKLGHEKDSQEIHRDLEGFYESPQRSQRHLHKPIVRY